jgi:hypothetical protein
MPQKEYSVKFLLVVKGEDTSEAKAREVMNALHSLNDTLQADELIGISQFVVENPTFLNKIRNMIEKSKRENKMPGVSEMMSFIDDLQKVVV